MLLIIIFCLFFILLSFHYGDSQKSNNNQSYTSKLSKKLSPLLKSYQTSKNEKDKTIILEELSSYIYLYPKIALKVYDEDLIGDFYIFFLQNFDRLILGFNEKKATFTTYLGCCLKRLWINYYKQYRRKKIKTVSLDQNEKISNNNRFFEDGNQKDNEILDGITSSFRLLTKEDQILEHFFKEIKNQEEYLYLKLYYLDFFHPDDLTLLQSISNQSYGKCLIFLKTIQEECAKKRKRKTVFQEKITKVYLKLMNLQSQIYQFSKNVSSEDNDSFYQLEEKYKILKREYEKSYLGVIVYPSFKSIALFFDQPNAKISNTIHNFKRKIKIKLEKNNYG